jgi:hypothetical protein
VNRLTHYLLSTGAGRIFSLLYAALIPQLLQIFSDSSASHRIRHHQLQIPPAVVCSLQTCIRNGRYHGRAIVMSG